MKICKFCMIVALIAGLTPSAVVAQPTDIRVLLTEHNHVAVLRSDGSRKSLTGGDRPKSLPRWSPDGSLIAYLELPLDHEDLMTLVVMTSVGAPISRIGVHTAGKTGLRYLESLVWAGNARILVGGEINPSTSEYLEYGIGRQRPLADVWVDGQDIAASPDGEHLATAEGAIHWARGDVASSQLKIDGKPVFTPVRSTAVSCPFRPGRLTARPSPRWHKQRRRDKASSSPVPMGATRPRR